MRFFLLMIAPLLFAPAGLSAAPPAAPTTRPAHDRDPWIFRCVLDGNARMIVVSLGDHYWVAYDAAHARLSKVWEGDVDLIGAVYDMRHGPQPKTKGRVLLEHPTADATADATAGATPDSSTHYRGYTTDNGVATMNVERNGVEMSETFELAQDADGSAVLKRTFKITKGVPSKGGPTIELPKATDVESYRLVAGALADVDGSQNVRFTTDAIALDQGRMVTVVSTEPVVIETRFKPKA